jgi:hypothetical protein
VAGRGLLYPIRSSGLLIYIFPYIQSWFKTWPPSRSTSAKKISGVRSLLNVSPRATAVRPASLLLEASRYALWREGKHRDEAKAASRFQPLRPRPTDAAMCERRRVGSRFVRKRGRTAILELLRVGPHRRRPLRTSLVFLIRLALSASSLSKIDLSHIDFVLAAACA